MVVSGPACWTSRIMPASPMSGDRVSDLGGRRYGASQSSPSPSPGPLGIGRLPHLVGCLLDPADRPARLLPTVGNFGVHQLTGGTPGRAGVPAGMVGPSGRWTAPSRPDQRTAEAIVVGPLPTEPPGARRAGSTSHR